MIFLDFFRFDKNIFAKRIRNLRGTKKINQAALAEVVGLSQTAIAKIESAERAASIEVLCALADYFDVSLDYLVGRSDDPARH
jgi:transcriptional regulator with XRE-family HTH domain